jgi:hypothetical protein
MIDDLLLATLVDCMGASGNEACWIDKRKTTSPSLYLKFALVGTLY